MTRRPQGEVQQVGKLKLSEAIRIGARLRPQGFGALFRNGESCAWGAAYEAICGYPGHGVFGFSDSHAGRMIGNVLSEYFPGIAADYVYERNDSEHMTREQIADWLESQGY